MDEKEITQQTSTTNECMNKYDVIRKSKSTHIYKT